MPETPGGVPKSPWPSGIWESRSAANFGNGGKFGGRSNYIKEEEPLETARVFYYLKGKVSDDFLLINDDLIFDVGFHLLMMFHKTHKVTVTLLAHPNKHPYDSGILLANADETIFERMPA